MDGKLFLEAVNRGLIVLGVFWSWISLDLFFHVYPSKAKLKPL